MPARSLELIEQVRTAVPRGTALRILDVGGGASTLPDHVVIRGVDRLSVLDIASTALDEARGRLGPDAAHVEWIRADITRFHPDARWDVWHDRALFHFLTEEWDRHAYVRALARAVVPGGHAIVATFAEDGPLRCSGRDIVRYDANALAEALAGPLRMICAERELHRTPSGDTQAFTYGLFQRAGPIGEGGT